VREAVTTKSISIAIIDLLGVDHPGEMGEEFFMASIGVVVLELATAEQPGERGKGIVTSGADATIVKLVEAIS
jgi:hypothetical protein